MEKINEIKLPKGVDRIAVKQYDDKIVLEFIPEEAKLKKGDLAIFWDNDFLNLSIRLYHAKSKSGNSYCDNFGTVWDNAIKFESKEQFEKVLRGEI